MSAATGRFPPSQIISLLDVNRPLNLAESTSQDLTVGELLDLVDLDALRALKLGYATSAGAPELREAIGQACAVPAAQVLTTQGTAHGLFLLALEACGPGDEAVLITPCFPPSRDGLIGAGAVVREVTSSFDHGYRLDLDRIAAAMSPRTTLVSLASPQNPSGVQTSRTEVERLLDLMRIKAPKAVLFIDETYREATYGDQAPGQPRRDRAPDHHRRLGLQSAWRTWAADRVAHGARSRAPFATDHRQDEHRDLGCGAR